MSARNRRFALTLDLKDRQDLIEAYEQAHREVWPGIRESLAASGIEFMEIYRFANRLFMLLEVDDSFSFERKAALDQANPLVRQWEELMGTFQQTLPGSAPGEKWRRMSLIYTWENNQEA